MAWPWPGTPAPASPRSSTPRSRPAATCGCCAAPATRCRRPGPLGPFRDLAGLVGLERLLRGDDDVLLSTVCEELYDALAAEPSVLVVEDLHWVDAASADVLRFLARRVESLPLALLVTYRDHEVGPRHSARSAARRLRPPRGPDRARARARSRSTRSPRWSTAPGSTPSRVHEVTGGNPFFVAEVVKDPDRPAARLGPRRRARPHRRHGRRRRRGAPARRHGPRPARRPGAPGARHRPADPAPDRRHRTDHPLPRRARCSATSWPARPSSRRSPPAAARACTPRSSRRSSAAGSADPAVLTHHAVAARDSARATSYARAAAEEASHAGAHTEAAAFYETALEHLGDSTDLERADLLVQLAYQQYMTSRLAEAIGNARASFRLFERAGDTAGLSRAQAATAVYEYYNARRRRAEDLVLKAEAVGAEAPAATGSLPAGEARATRGYLAYMANDYDLALDCYEGAEGWGDRALRDPGLLRPRVDRAHDRRARRPGTARRPRRGGAVARVRRARLHGLLQPRVPRRRAPSLPARRARARGVDPVHRRARHPDLPALADRDPLTDALQPGSLGRGARGRRQGAGTRTACRWPPCGRTW